MRDLIDELVAGHRDVQRRGSGDGEEIAVSVHRRYDAAIGDVWSAVTEPDRLARWFAPVSGDLRVGGAFQVEGNAGGEVQECDPPHAFAVSWGGPQSILRLRLTAEGGGTRLDLEHSVPVAFAGSGAGALYVGPGWDVAVLGLALFLRGEPVGDPVAWEGTPEVQRYNAATIDAWAGVVAASGTAEPEDVDAAVAAARAQFTPAPEAEQPAEA